MKLSTLLASLCLVGAIGCGGGSDSTATSTNPGASTTDAPSPSASTSTARISTTTPTAPTTTSPPATTDPGESTTTTTTTTPPPTTIGDTEGAIDTGASTIWGLRLFAFRPSDDVVRVVSDRLGSPSSDTGFLPMPAEFECTGSESYRVVRWGDLRITFTEGFTDPASAPPETDSTERMLAFSVGDDAAGPLSPTDEPPADPTPTGITTDEGIGIGSSRDDFLSAIPEEQILSSGDDDRISVFDPEAIHGPPTATLFTFADDTVTGIGAGPADCIDSEGL